MSHEKFISNQVNSLLDWFRNDRSEFMSKIEAARIAGVNHSTFRSVDNKDWSPRAVTLVGIARARDVWEKRRAKSLKSELEVK